MYLYANVGVSYFAPHGWPCHRVACKHKLGHVRKRGAPHETTIPGRCLSAALPSLALCTPLTAPSSGGIPKSLLPFLPYARRAGISIFLRSPTHMSNSDRSSPFKTYLESRRRSARKQRSFVGERTAAKTRQPT